MELIRPNDPRLHFFMQLNHYQVVSKDGESIVDNWEDVRNIWWNKKVFHSTDKREEKFIISYPYILMFVGVIAAL